ncbi:MAG: hypothetical protein ACI4U0_05150 [Candidatus Aphodocola sp.]
MISYYEFKKIFDVLDEKRNPEIEIYFKDNDSYILIKFESYLTYSKMSGTKEDVLKFNNLNDLYESNLKSVWNEISDILIDMTFSVVSQKEEILKNYNLKLK